MRILLIILFNLSLLSIHGQFTYFNELYGEFGDQETELTTNVEVVGDSIYLFGAVNNDQDPSSYLLRIIDVDGNIINENSFSISAPTPVIGYGWSLNTSINNRIIYTQAAIDDDVLGFATMLNLNLDTIWSRTYNDYSPFTHFRANVDVGDGIVVTGSHDVGNTAGTFLMKLDYFGNVIWNEVTRYADGLIYYNKNIITLNNGYLLGGSRTMGQWNAMLTKTDLEGNVEWEYYADNFVDDQGEPADSQEYRLTKLPNGEIVGAHMVWYEFAGSNPSPNNPNWWTSLRLSKINVEDTSLYWEHDYLTDYELKTGLLWKIITTQDNGILAMGMHQGFGYTWLLKVDSLGDQEWFKTYPFDFVDFEAYKPYDIEMTSDGGFVIVGEHFSWSEDNYSQSWVMKIDACGDVEWQGCDYVGIQESKENKFKFYPNPTSDVLHIEGDGLTSNAQIMVYDMLGNIVLDATVGYEQQVSLIDLTSGLYQVVLVHEGVVVGSEKVVVE